MNIKQSDYEKLLAEYSCRHGAIALLRQYRPYLETLPSTRRPEESLICIPLPVVRIRQLQPIQDANSVNTWEVATSLPCDVGIIMCDPEWKIKMGTEILVFIQRPHEDFSQLLNRWRTTQVHLDLDYQWLMPLGEEHILSEAAEKVYPLFVLFGSTSQRIKDGLEGAGLPFIVACNSPTPEEKAQSTLV